MREPQLEQSSRRSFADASTSVVPRFRVRELSESSPACSTTRTDAPTRFDNSDDFRALARIACALRMAALLTERQRDDLCVVARQRSGI